ncbi:MAG: insulinase family protein [Candidatus Coprenecus sp.]
MKAIFLTIVLFLASIFSSNAQFVGVIENDPTVLKKEMDNGLTYYIIKNNTIQGFADFSLVIKQVDISNSPCQRSIPALIETMSLTQSRNFPDGEILTFLANMGVEINTGIQLSEENGAISFHFPNIPVKKNSKVVDSMLLALYNISGFVEINDKTVGRGKALLKNFLASRIAPGSGIMFDSLCREIDSIRTDDVRSFYGMYCKPDIQSIVICGDINPSEVCMKIEALFQTIPKPERPTPVISTEPSMKDSVYTDTGSVRTTTPAIIYTTDPEAYTPSVTYEYITEDIHPSLRRTAFPFVATYYRDLTLNILYERLHRHILRENIPFISLKAEPIRHKGTGSFIVKIETPERYIVDAYRFLASELDLLSREGALEQEISRAKEMSYFERDYLYTKNVSGQNSHLTRLCIDNYVNGYGIFSPSLYRAYLEVTDRKSDIVRINDYIRGVLSDTLRTSYRVLSSASAGTLDSLVIPTLESCASDTLLYAAEVAKVPEYKTKSTFTAKSVNPVIGSISRKLPNGVRIHLKEMKNKSGWIWFEAAAKGGLSLLDSNIRRYNMYLNSLCDISIVDSMDKYRFSQIQRGAHCTIEREVTMEQRIIRGHFHKDYSDEFLTLVSAYFKGTLPDTLAFENLLKVWRENPTTDISTNTRQFILEKKRKRDESLPTYQEYTSMIGTINRLFSNPADFQFFFVGDTDDLELTNSAIRTIGVLPSKPTVRIVNENKSLSFSSYDKRSSIPIKMNFDREYHNLKILFPSPMKINDRLAARVLCSIIEKRVLTGLYREGIMASSSLRFNRFPKESAILDFTMMTCEIPFDAEERIMTIIHELLATGISGAEIQSSKKILELMDEYDASTDPNYWLSILNERYIEQKDFLKEKKTVLDSITEISLNELLSQILDSATISWQIIKPQKDE